MNTPERCKKKKKKYIYIHIYQVGRTVLVSVRIFVNKMNTYRLKDDNADDVQGSQLFLEYCASFSHSIVTSRARDEKDHMKA